MPANVGSGGSLTTMHAASQRAEVAAQDLAGSEVDAAQCSTGFTDAEAVRYMARGYRLVCAEGDGRHGASQSAGGNVAAGLAGAGTVVNEDVGDAVAADDMTSAIEAHGGVLRADGRGAATLCSKLCAHNARVAAATGAMQVAHAWQALHFILPEGSAVTGNGALTGSGTADVFGAADGDSVPPSEGAAATGWALSTGGAACSSASDAPERGSAPSPNVIVDALPRSLLLASVAPVISALMAHHALRGDVQPCAVLARALSSPEMASTSTPINSVLGRSLPPKGLMRRWFRAYGELLQRMQLFDVAHNVVKESGTPLLLPWSHALP